MSKELPQQALFALFATVAKALAHPYRLELLEQLSQGERNVEVLADRIQTSLSNTSQHLLAMRRAGLVDSRREGNLRFYYIADEGVLGLLAWLRSIAERNSAEFERVLRGYFQIRDNLEPVARMELMERLQAGLVTVLDLRPEDEFALGHLPGAVNIQLDELMERLAEFDPEREIVAYSRGPYCPLSYEAVAMLRGRGFKIRRLEDGLPEWRAAGLPLDLDASRNGRTAPVSFRKR